MSMRTSSLVLAALLFSAPAWGSAPPTTTFPALSPLNPIGSLIYFGNTDGTIGSAGEQHAYTLGVDPFQTITIIGSPRSGTFQPTIQLQDPSNSVIGSATAASAGQPALIQTAPASTGGTYTITVSGASGTIGNYEIAVLLNSAIEEESIGIGGAGSNDTPATAQNIDASAVGLLGDATRLAVAGLGPTGGADYYSFSLGAGESATIVLTRDDSGSTLELRDGSGNALATGVAGPTNVTLAIRNFVAGLTGTYYVRIGGTATGAYTVVVTRDADFDVEGNGTFAGAQDLPPGEVLGYIGNGCALDSDFYAFEVTAGDNLVITTTTPADGHGEFVNTLAPTINLYDQAGNLVASAIGNAADGRNSIINWTALSSGAYRIQIGGANGTTGEYILRVQGDTGGSLPFVFTPDTTPCTALTAASPAHLWIGLKNSDNQGTNFDLKVELLKNGKVVTSGLQRCIIGVTRRPSAAKEAIVAFDSFSAVPAASGDVLSLRVSTRIGTNPDDTKCAGHSSAVGLRLYYDAASRTSRFDATITPNSSEDLYLHSDGELCTSNQSSGVTTRSLSTTAPTAAAPRCKDSGIVNFSGGNPFSVIGTWTLAPLP